MNMYELHDVSIFVCFYLCVHELCGSLSSALSDLVQLTESGKHKHTHIHILPGVFPRAVALNPRQFCIVYVWYAFSRVNADTVPPPSMQTCAEAVGVQRFLFHFLRKDSFLSCSLSPGEGKSFNAYN